MRGARRRRVETDDEDEDEEEEISTEAQLKELKRREAWLKKELKKMQKSRTKRSSAGKVGSVAQKRTTVNQEVLRKLQSKERILQKRRRESSKIDQQQTPVAKTN